MDVKMQVQQLRAEGLSAQQIAARLSQRPGRRASGNWKERRCEVGAEGGEGRRWAELPGSQPATAIPEVPPDPKVLGLSEPRA